MKKVFSMVALATLFVASIMVALIYANQNQHKAASDARVQADAKSQEEVKTKSGEVRLNSGSRIEADMNSTLDLRKAKPGDPFKMKTSRPVKRDGKEMISKGSTITGHVEQVTRADGNTRATLVFDQIQDKKTGATSSIQAVVKTIVKAERPSSMMDDEMQARRPASRQQRSGGGLVGGAVDTVGGVAGQVSSTVNSTISSDAGTGSAIGALGRGAIQIVADATSTAASGSTLAVSNQSPRIDSGTRFILETTSALTFTTGSREKKN